MSESDSLNRLRDHRAALLTCEAIGWLHMAGKAHPDFLRQNASGGPLNGQQWDVKTWAKNLYSKFGTLPHFKTLPQTDAQTISPRDLFEKYEGSGADGVLGLLQAAHAMSSGIEKNTPADYLKQPHDQMWLTTAFGHPVQNLLLDKDAPAVLASDGWSKLETQIGTLIDGLVARIQEPKNLGKWQSWRADAIGPAGWLREAFTSTLAETRVPNNDVTLWDQSFIAAALFKAAAAGAVLTGSLFEWKEKIKANTRWRVLTVGIGAEHYEARAVRIGDWTGTREVIARFFDEVCSFIEVDLALGACVYRDERTLAFTFPGHRFDGKSSVNEGKEPRPPAKVPKPGHRLDGKSSVDDALAEIVRKDIEDRVNELAQSYCFEFETPPLVQISPSTRSFVAMAGELAKARGVLEVPVHRSRHSRWSINGDGSTGMHVCPVSLVRAGHHSNSETHRKQTDRKQDVSKVCYERRTGRRAEWQASGGDTIWISEVADGNDRVALLTFSLGLEGWLDGRHVDSLRAQSVAEWSKHNTNLASINQAQPRDSLRTYLEAFVQPQRESNATLDDRVLNRLSAGFKSETSLADFFRKVVEDRSGAPKYSSLDEETKAAWLIHQLFRKNASPGRVHRFWRTTQTFFAEVLAAIRQLDFGGGVARTRRLRLTLSGDTSGLRVGETFAGPLPLMPDAPFEILRREDDFVTICNLARVLGPDGDAAQLNGLRFEAKDDDGQQRRFVIESSSVCEAPLASYRPIIVLEENPERFRVLVPLDKAADCVDIVVKKWRTEMARVWDRLPLRAGIIGFPRKTPFQAVIEATRNVEDDLAVQADERWRVTEVITEADKTTLTFNRPDNGLERIDVPTKLCDGREDVYYPNVAVFHPERELRDFTAPRRDGPEVVFRQVSELKSGDEVRVDPSRFAAVFLDSTARRFEPTRQHPLSDWQRSLRIWQLVEKAALSSTAAHAVEQSLGEARERWTNVEGALDDSAWNDWIAAVLTNEWNARGSDLTELEKAACDGLLEHVLSWHLHVLKQKIGEKP